MLKDATFEVNRKAEVDREYLDCEMVMVREQEAKVVLSTCVSGIVSANGVLDGVDGVLDAYVMRYRILFPPEILFHRFICNLRPRRYTVRKRSVESL